MKLAPKSKILTKKRKRLIKTPKRGGYLPLLFPLLGALGALGGGAAGIAKAVNDAKTQNLELEEQKRHNAAVEAAMKELLKGKGFFFKIPIFKKLPINLPKRALTNFDICHYIDLLKLPYFRGVFCRDELPAKIHKRETGVVNLDGVSGFW